ncbi:hypothetical protein PVK06_049248 [Gossypium arboreum]|uniref:Uncharacterized protein n=1 Tax=Gossypium arboreum TaxID=29729 RepID=A0ABR0MII0_GOSAR|nr:hypothetical protein PVK06_049248 [Gossypium arboreum]
MLGCMDIDLTLREEQLAPLIAKTTHYVEKDFERWDRSNRMSLIIMKHSIPKAFEGTGFEEITQAKVSLMKLRNVLLKTIRGYEFYDPTIRNIFETRTATIFEDVEFGGRNKVRNIAFKKELNSNLVPTITFDDVLVLIPITDQEVNPEPQ